MSEMRKIFIASDHGGFAMKEMLIEHLSTRDITIIDGGCDSDDSVDYPDYGADAAHAILDKEADGAIILCGSGIGICIAANRHAGIRAALCPTPEYVTLARQHNNANMIAMGGRLVDDETAKKCADAFMDTAFDGGERHVRRIEKLG